jgi:hypothetical protein
MTEAHAENHGDYTDAQLLESASAGCEDCQEWYEDAAIYKAERNDPWSQDFWANDAYYENRPPDLPAQQY